jgi:hypothetical protein
VERHPAVGRRGAPNAPSLPAHPRGSEDPGLRPVHSWRPLCAPIPAMRSCINKAWVLASARMSGIMGC